MLWTRKTSRHSCANSRKVRMPESRSAEAAKHTGSIVLLPEGKAEILASKASGNCQAIRMVPRARIGLATPAFLGPRSTNELPRHGSSLRFYGKVAALKRENGLDCWPRG